MPAIAGPRDGFSLTEGGPFFHLLARLHVPAPYSAARCWTLAALVWLPLVIGQIVRSVTGGPADPMLLDLSTHVRILFGLPVLLVSEGLLERAANSAIASLYHGNFCKREALDRIVRGAERMRDAWFVEAALLGLALLGGQLVLWRALGPTRVFHGGDVGVPWWFSHLWYSIVALPLVQFVMYRWLWRWAIWSWVLVRIARQPLALLATHADHAGGLGLAARPVSAFSGLVLAIGAVLASAWGTQVLRHLATLKSLLPGLAVFLLVALAVAMGPLLAFSGHLYRARRRGLAQYGDFVRDYTLAFHRKWITPRPDRHEEPLGSSDIQSLNDLGQSFEVVMHTRLFVFGARQIAMIWGAALIPMIPLLASALTVEQVLKHIVTTVIGGFPT